MSNWYKAESFPRCVLHAPLGRRHASSFPGHSFFLLKDERQNIVGTSFVENWKSGGFAGGIDSRSLEGHMVTPRTSFSHSHEKVSVVSYKLGFCNFVRV